MLVNLLAGMPINNTVNAPVKCRLGPITVAEATPVSSPVLSPLVIGTVVAKLCAGIPIISIVRQLGIAVGPIEIFGYGIGIGGAGGAGVKHTSGNPISIPIICVFANISHLSTDIKL
jgi:hypothetical protein